MTAFKKWYAEHGQELSETRKEKYKNDPEYREKAKERAKAYRARKRQDAPQRDPKYSQTSVDVTKALDISGFVLRDMRSRNLYPQPYAFGNRFYFTPEQVELLKGLVETLNTMGRRPTPEQQQALSDRVSLIYANWE